MSLLYVGDRVRARFRSIGMSHDEVHQGEGTIVAVMPSLEFQPDGNINRYPIATADVLERLGSHDAKNEEDSP